MNVKKILVVVVIGIIVGAAVVLCLRSNVPDNGVGADTVREQLDGAIRLEQQTIRDVYSLRKEMIEQESSLETARVSLEQFEKEEQAKLNRAKQEKTAAWIIAGLLLCVCIGK